jgi:2-dehydropantoate 2-reductase
VAWFATILARSGATVSVVPRGQTLAALKSNGVCLITNGEMLQAFVQVSEDPSELGVQDYVIIAVKAPSLPDVARRIGPLLGPETTVVTAMNGVPWWFFLNPKGISAGHRLKAIDPRWCNRSGHPDKESGGVPLVRRCLRRGTRYHSP